MLNYYFSTYISFYLRVNHFSSRSVFLFAPPPKCHLCSMLDVPAACFSANTTWSLHRLGRVGPLRLGLMRYKYILDMNVHFQLLHVEVSGKKVFDYFYQSIDKRSGVRISQQKSMSVSFFFFSFLFKGLVYAFV